MKPLTMIVVFVLIVSPWFINAAKFIGCDFSSPYKCEAIHGIGVVVPPAAFVTAWFGGD